MSKEYWVEFSDGTQCFMFGRSPEHVRRDVLEALSVWDIEAAMVYDSRDKETRKQIMFVE